MKILGLCLIVVSVHCGPVIDTPFGEVEGLEHVTDSGVKANIYLGVRYANAPDHIHRFERPHIVDSWAPIRHHATHFRASCIPFHSAFLTEEKNYSEDCLFMNIFTPAENGTYPVLFFIHGGGFELGDSIIYGYKKLTEKFVSQGIIVVTIQYRLGALGFFSTGDSAGPGNMGLWDQAVALTFVHQVIPFFGGDVERITVMGNSAGSASASALLFSPHGHSFFDQAIELSGSTFAEFAMSDSVVEESLELARVLDCSNDDNKKVVECMKEKTVQEILDGVEKIGSTRNHPNFIKFHPRIDGQFFPKDVHLLVKGAPPKRTLAGVTNQEGALFTQLSQVKGFAGTLIPKEELTSYSEHKLKAFITNAVAPEHEYGSKAQEFQEMLIDFYITKDAPANPDSNFYLQRYTDLLSDLLFNVPVMQEAELKRMNQWETFLYVIHHNAKTDHPKYAPIKGAWHASELKYISDYAEPNTVLEKKDEQFGTHFVESIANFVKTGNPSTSSFKWPAISSENPWIHASLGVTPGIKDNYRPEAIEFWFHTVPKAIGVRKLHTSRLPASHAHRLHHTEL